MCLLIIALASECVEGAIRLQGDRGPNEGEVELCHDGIWSVVCGSEWDHNNAKVACTQLQLPTTGTYTVIQGTVCYTMYICCVHIVVEAINGYDAKGVDAYVLSAIQCDGTEDRLLECVHSDFVYTVCETNGAGVKCLSGA